MPGMLKGARLLDSEAVSGQDLTFSGR